MTPTADLRETVAEAMQVDEHHLNQFDWKSTAPWVIQEGKPRYYRRAAAALNAIREAGLAVVRRDDVLVNPEPLAALKQEAERWAEFFSPYIEDDNKWYCRTTDIDGHDAGELGEFAQSVLKLIAKIDRLRAAVAEGESK